MSGTAIGISRITRDTDDPPNFGMMLGLMLLDTLRQTCSRSGLASLPYQHGSMGLFLESLRMIPTAFCLTSQPVTVRAVGECAHVRLGTLGRVYDPSTSAHR